MKTWRERIATPLADRQEPLNAYPAVLWPSLQRDLVMDLDVLLYTVQLGAGVIDEAAPFPEPSQDQIDFWLMQDWSEE